MRRFYIEFLLTTLVFAHVLFGVIYFRARRKLKKEEALAVEENRERLGLADLTLPRENPSGGSRVTDPPSEKIPVDKVFERITDARRKNDNSTIEREIERLVSSGAGAIPALHHGGELRTSVFRVMRREFRNTMPEC